jgi:hypothetical protein
MKEYHDLPLAAINSECCEVNVCIDLNATCFPVGFSDSMARVLDPAEMVGPLVNPFYLGVAKVAHEADRDTLGRLSVDAVDHFNGDLHAPRFHLEISRRYRVSIASTDGSGISCERSSSDDKDNGRTGYSV